MSIALARLGANLPIAREITLKNFCLESNQECANLVMDTTYTCQSENDQMGGEKNDDSMIIIIQRN
jgi:hypothetical protein